MEKKKVKKFPNGFFQKERPAITASEALKDIIPIKWDEKINDKKNKDEQTVKLVKPNN